MRPYEFHTLDRVRPGRLGRPSEHLLNLQSGEFTAPVPGLYHLSLALTLDIDTSSAFPGGAKTVPKALISIQCVASVQSHKLLLNIRSY